MLPADSPYCRASPTLLVVKLKINGAVRPPDVLETLLGSGSDALGSFSRTSPQTNFGGCCWRERESFMDYNASCFQGVTNGQRDS